MSDWDQTVERVRVMFFDYRMDTAEMAVALNVKEAYVDRILHSILDQRRREKVA
jgi:hypothetical protein